MLKKTMLSAALLLACALMLAGCNKKEETPASTPQSTAPTSSSVSQPAPAADDTDSSQAAPTGGTPSEGADTITGTVEDASMNTLYLSDATGVIYLFSTEGVEIEGGADGLEVGDTVTVSFEGTIQPTDQMQDVTVTSVVVSE